jgi:glycosyltransferase involved in cell wall biosynthesis
MKISVVTVCFNSERTIGDTIESFLFQDHADKELVIVDGGSTDRTLSIVDRFPQDQIFVQSERDAGIYDAMNKGLRRFTGDAVGFLNSDDRYADRRALTRLSGALSDVDIAFGDLNIVTGSDRPRVIRHWRTTPFYKGAFLRGWMPPHPTFYIRRAVVEAVGEFNLIYRVAADYDYMLRAMEHFDFKSTAINEILVEMRLGGKSTDGLKIYAVANFESLRSRQHWLGVGFVDQALLTKPLGKVTQFFARKSEAPDAV